MHFNVPVGITLDKSWEYERPHNPKGRHQTTYNSRQQENSILCKRKLLVLGKRKKKVGGWLLFREHNKVWTLKTDEGPGEQGKR